MRQHLVQVYKDDAFLADRASAFLQEGLTTGETAVVIATPEHVAAITKRLSGDRIVVRDARETLALFMRGDRPQKGLFDRHVGGIVQEAERMGSGTVRAYGEMVAILWEEGNHQAAIELEDLWNRLPGAQRHSLFCAYRLGGFDSASHADGFQAICDAHSDVFPSELNEGEMQRRIAILEQKAVTLQAEVSRRVQAERALAESDRRKDDFIATLAHEIRNPLTPIASAAQMLQRPLAPDQSERFAQTISRQTATLSRLVDDLLDARRIVAGRIRIDGRPLRVRELVDRAADAAHAAIESRQHTFDVHPPDDDVWVEGDPARLVQALCNVLDNAAKFTTPGGRITLRVNADVEAIRIAVQDNGRGMDPTFLESVFEPYVQAPDGLGEGGLGLGLSVVQGIARLHGGTVEASSPGRHQGATVTLTLPRIHPPARATMTPSGRADVLIVDDNRDIRETLASLLEAYGHGVRAAANGADALQALDDRPDIVLLDLGMPGMDGFEVARRIRERADPPLLVALSGHADLSRDDARLACFDHRLAKPPDIDRLMALVAGSAKR